MRKKKTAHYNSSREGGGRGKRFMYKLYAGNGKKSSDRELKRAFELLKNEL